MTKKRINNNKNSCVKDHCILSAQVCSFEDITVLNYKSHRFKCLIKEPLLVTNDQPLLNKQVKSLKLGLFWFYSTYAIFCYTLDDSWQMLFMTKDISKETVERSRLLNRFLKDCLIDCVSLLRKTKSRFCANLNKEDILTVFWR